MSMTAKAILALLLALPRYSADTETAEQRTKRLETVATSIDVVSESATCSGRYEGKEGCKRFWPLSAKALQRLLITEGFFETGFAQRVHEGHCLKHECDGGRARGPWQLQRNGLMPIEAWEKMTDDGEESTRVGAFYAARKLAQDLNACQSMEGAIARYATGSSCTWSGAPARVRFFERLMAKD